MKTRYCYWSVCDGIYSKLMERCVASARNSGVFKEFHLLTDTSIPGCECYDAMDCDKKDGLFKLVCLKAAISNLLFDYFIWIDADSYFVKNPKNILDCLGKSPMHVPLLVNLSDELKNRSGKGDDSLSHYVEVMKAAGITNPVYSSQSSFWIVHRDAIDRVQELAQHFRGVAQKHDFPVNASTMIGFAMQMLCGDPESHEISRRPDLWGSDDNNYFKDTVPTNSPWMLDLGYGRQSLPVNPAIVHLPHGKQGMNPSLHADNKNQFVR